MEMQELSLGNEQDEGLPRPVKIMGVVAALMLIGFVAFIMFSFEGEDPREVRQAMLDAQREPEGEDEHGTLRFPWDEPPVADPGLQPVEPESDIPVRRVIGLTGGDEAMAFVLNTQENGKDVMFVSVTLGGVPVIVTHDYFHETTRCFTKNGSTEMPELRLGGLEETRTLVLLYNDVRYRQLSERIPLDEYPFTITSLAEWVRDHPNTLVSERDYDFEPYTNGQSFY